MILSLGIALLLSLATEGCASFINAKLGRNIIQRKHIQAVAYNFSRNLFRSKIDGISRSLSTMTAHFYIQQDN